MYEDEELSGSDHWHSDEDSAGGGSKRSRIEETVSSIVSLSETMRAQASQLLSDGTSGSQT